VTGAPDSGRLSFVKALSASAAVSLESKALIKAQKDLFEAFIQLIAAAIDAKSPYTGGHCARVPELTRMLADAACAADSGPYKDFALSEDDWEALHVAAWLHDCGKVTTPEYVVDKATKLETIHDRIHEVRMRFEVLKRDAEIDCLRAIAGRRRRRSGTSPPGSPRGSNWTTISPSSRPATKAASPWRRHDIDRLRRSAPNLAANARRPHRHLVVKRRVRKASARDRGAAGCRGAAGGQAGAPRTAARAGSDTRRTTAGDFG
jgi:hypothetical protein